MTQATQTDTGRPDGVMYNRDPAQRALLGRRGLVLSILAIIFLVVWQAPPHHAFEGVARYAWLHAVLETFTTAIAGMVFGVAWNAYSKERPGNVLFLASGLFATGILGVAHMLSFAGMPDFVTSSGPEKAINFWLATRYLLVIVLLWTALRPWKPLSHPNRRYVQLGAYLCLVGLVLWVGLYHQQLLPRTFIPGHGLTPLKIGAEYLLVGLFLVAAIAFLRLSRPDATYNLSSLSMAAMVFMLSELCFTLYSDVTDVFNLLGHVYNLIAYGYVYHAVFVCSVREPFARLELAEAKSRASSVYARSLIEASLDPMMTVSLSGKVTGANHAAEEVTGTPRVELVGKDFEAFFTDPEKARSVYRSVIANGTARDLALVIRRTDGRETEVLCNASVYCDDAGQIAGIFVAARDVTETRRAHALLLASEKRLRQAMSAARMGAWTWDVVNDRVAYSDEFSVLLGLPKGASHAGREAFFAAVHPADRTMLADKIERALHGDEDYWAHFRVIWPDGSIHWIEVHASIAFDAAGQPQKLSGVGLDITERMEGQLALERANRALRTLSAGNDRLIHAQDKQSLLNEVCRVIVETGGYRMAWVGLTMRDERKTVRPVAHYGVEDGFLDAVEIRWSETDLGHGPTGTAIRTGVTQVVQDLAVNPAMGPWRTEALKRGYQACIAFPLRDAAGVHASLTIYAAEPDAFSTGEVRLLQELADDLAFGIATLHMRAERDRMIQVQQEHDSVLRTSLVESIQAISTTLEMRDPYTAGHQRRVAMLASAIGREMGLSESTIEGMHLAASIHDVGKIHIPSEILNRPGKISPIELELIKTHAQAGHDIVKDVRYPWPIARIILEHHERLDGSGYPNHLKGDEILLESRIVTVADVVEAMMSHRPYRPGLGLDTALEHIAGYRGVWYEPQAVDACLRLFREKQYSFDALPEAM